MNRSYTFVNIRMIPIEPPKAPHLSKPYPVEICPTVAKALKAQGCISPFELRNGIELVGVHPRSACLEL